MPCDTPSINQRDLVEAKRVSDTKDRNALSGGYREAFWPALRASGAWTYKIRSKATLAQITDFIDQTERDTGFETGVGGRTRAIRTLRVSNVHICTD